MHIHYLVRSEIALESLVLLLERLEFVELRVPEVLRQKHLLLAGRPRHVDVGLVVELLGEMFETFQSGEQEKLGFRKI